MFEFLLAPRYFKPLPKPVLLGLSAAILLLFGFALYQALVVSPIDYQQGETVRMMYVHVPAAWLCMGIYMLMAFMGISFLAFKTPMAMVIAHAAAPLGAVFTAITLITGMIWGKPMWGAWWVWDARLTSVLLLFFLYLGYIALAQSTAYGERGFKSSAILAIVGAVNIPVIKFSVEWWNTLHQPASIIRAGGISIHETMLIPLFSMFAAYMGLFLLLLYLKISISLRKQKRKR
jgi:heme exporter protein C